MERSEKRLTVEVSTTATLSLTYESPQEGTVVRPVTDEELRAMRLFSADEMYDVTKHNLAALGIDAKGEVGSQLRCFIEQSTHYLRKLDGDEMDGFKGLVAALTPSKEPN